MEVGKADLGTGNWRVTMSVGHPAKCSRRFRDHSRNASALDRTANRQREISNHGGGVQHIAYALPPRGIQLIRGLDVANGALVAQSLRHSEPQQSAHPSLSIFALFMFPTN